MEPRHLVFYSFSVNFSQCVLNLNCLQYFASWQTIFNFAFVAWQENLYVTLLCWEIFWRKLWVNTKMDCATSVHAYFHAREELAGLEEHLLLRTSVCLCDHSLLIQNLLQGLEKWARVFSKNSCLTMKSHYLAQFTRRDLRTLSLKMHDSLHIFLG